MVLAYHLVFGMYGFWLPNDPRGSGSKFVGAEHLRPFGAATGLEDRTHSVSQWEHDWRLRLAAKGRLKYPAVKLNGLQAKAAGDGFGEYVSRNGIIVWACSVLTEHVHLVIGRHHYDVETIGEQLKAAGTRRLIKEGVHPFGHIRTAKGRPPCCWQRGSWSPFLETPDEIYQRMRMSRTTRSKKANHGSVGPLWSLTPGNP